MAIDIADRLGAEVMSVDSMQVYRGMDIGTAKPTVVERRGVTHHMIDVAEPEEEFTVAEFRRMGRKVMESANAPLVIAGGSGLHFRALVDPMNFAPTDRGLRLELEQSEADELAAELLAEDPHAAMHVDMANPRRVLRAVEVLRLTGETPTSRAASAEADEVRRYEPEFSFQAIGIDPGDLLDDRIDRRLADMRAGGLVDEVRRLRPRLGRTARSAVGYREILLHLTGETTEEEAFAAASGKTKKVAKKQRTWFQRDPRIRWIPWLEDPDHRSDRAMEALS